jgi:hypothetical protein
MDGKALGADDLPAKAMEESLLKATTPLSPVIEMDALAVPYVKIRPLSPSSSIVFAPNSLYTICLTPHRSTSVSKSRANIRARLI